MASERNDIVPSGVRSEVHGGVCSHVKLHAIKEDESCIYPSLVRIPLLVRHEVGMIGVVVGRCPGRRCHVIQLLNSLIIKDAATYPTSSSKIVTY